MSKLVTALAALVGWGLAAVQLWLARVDRQEDERRRETAEARLDSLEAHRRAPDLQFTYWRFQGATRDICSYFDHDLRVSLPRVRALADSARNHAEQVFVVPSPVLGAVLDKRQQVCGSRDPLRNNAKDWLFLLAVNSTEHAGIVTRISYRFGTSEPMRLDLTPSRAMLVPLGFRFTDRNLNSDPYAWPDSITLAWSWSNRVYERTVKVRGVNVGYTLDAGTDIVFLEPPPLPPARP